MSNCDDWYLNTNYESKEDCLEKQHQTKPSEDTTTVSTQDTVTQTGVTTISVSESEPDSPAHGIRNGPDIEILVPTEDTYGWNEMYGVTTETETAPTTEEVSTVPFTVDEVFTADQIEARIDETGRAVVHVEFGGMQLGLVITGTAVGVILLVTGVIALSEYITRRFFDDAANPNADPDRSTFPLTAVQPTAPEDSREVEETVAGSFRTAFESTLAPGRSSGSFDPPVSPVRTASLPNLVPSSSSGPARRQMDRTQSTIAFNLDDTVGDEFDALAMRHQPTGANLSNLSVLRPAAQIIVEAEVHGEEARPEEEVVEPEEGEAVDEPADAQQEPADAQQEPAEAAPAGGTTQRRQSTRLRRQFQPTQYGDL